MQTARYLTARQVAAMTGVSIRTVWAWCNSGKLKASRPGGRDYFIRPEDLDDFMSSTAKTKKN